MVIVWIEFYTKKVFFEKAALQNDYNLCVT